MQLRLFKCVGLDTIILTELDYTLRIIKLLKVVQ